MNLLIINTNMDNNKQPTPLDLLLEIGNSGVLNYGSHELRTKVGVALGATSPAPATPNSGSKWTASDVYECLCDLIDEVPFETEDADWWPDHLKKCMERAKAIRDEYDPPQPSPERDAIAFSDDFEYNRQAVKNMWEENERLRAQIKQWEAGANQLKIIHQGIKDAENSRP